MNVIISALRRPLRSSILQHFDYRFRYKSSEATVKTDGSSQPSPPPRGGIGCYVPMSNTQRSAPSELKNPSSIGTEVEAAIEGLGLLVEKHPEAKLYKIQTDCTTVAALLNDRLKPNWWKKNGLQELEKKWKGIVAETKTRGGSVRIVSIDRTENTVADKLAKKGVKMAEEGGGMKGKKGR